MLRSLMRPPWRTLVCCSLLLLIIFAGYQLWNPAEAVTDGRHDLLRNGIWLQHGWLGDTSWFQRNKKDPAEFRNPDAVLRLKQQLLEHHLTDLYPHLAPCAPSGEIPPVDAQQTQQFLTLMEEFRVMPWVGGVLNVHAFPESARWRQRFIASVQDLLLTYPSLAGIHVNIEPLPSGHKAFPDLLRELKQSLPPGRILSVAAYPPPTIYQHTAEVHWDESYYHELVQHVDQFAVMMYDTGLRYRKLYQQLMKAWTLEILAWAGETEVLLGVPAYDDKGVGYHHPHIENLRNSLLGIHAGLAEFKTIPSQYKGIAIYSEWEMEPAEWEVLRRNFLREKN